MATQSVKKFLAAFETQDFAVFDEVLAPHFYSHMATAEDHKDANKSIKDTYISFVKSHPHIKVEILRTAEEGDTVFAYSNMTGLGEPKVCVDIFRFEGSKIAEHWYVIQDQPAVKH